MIKEFLTIKEAAELVGVCKNTMYKEANNPRFPLRRTSPRGKILINRQKLIDYFSNQALSAKARRRRKCKLRLSHGNIKYRFRKVQPLWRRIQTVYNL